jgi:hypothetical protein
VQLGFEKKSNFYVEKKTLACPNAGAVVVNSEIVGLVTVVSYYRFESSAIECYTVIANL